MSLRVVFGGSIIVLMVIDMNEAQVRTLDQVRQVLAGAQQLQFHPIQDADRYAWIGTVLRRFDDLRPGCRPRYIRCGFAMERIIAPCHHCTVNTTVFCWFDRALRRQGVFCTVLDQLEFPCP